MSEFDNSTSNGLIDVYIELSSESEAGLYKLYPRHNRTGNMMKCPLCDMSFASKSTLCCHGRQIHQKQLTVNSSNEVFVSDDLLVKCPECDFTVKRKGRLTRHLKENHGIVEDIKCKSCGKKFLSHRALQHHFSQFHTYNNMPCELCGKICKNRSAFQRHQLMHTRSFTCEQCGKAFEDRRCYTQHVKIHKARTQFQCEHCYQTFTQKSNMLNHIKIQHLKEGKLKCDLCQFSTFYKDVLATHIDRVHKKLKKVKFICTYCSKTFSRRLVFDEHVDKHEGRYRYSCQFCARRYRNKARCKSHSALCEFSTQYTTGTQNVAGDSIQEVSLQVFSSMNENVIEETDLGMQTILG